MILTLILVVTDTRQDTGGETIPTFACKDIGMQCGFQASAPTENELMPKIAEHAAKAHNIMKVDPALGAKIKAAIKK